MKNLLTFLGLLVFAVAQAGESPQPIPIDKLNLRADLSNGRAVFTLESTAQVHDPHGGALRLLGGPVAITRLPSNSKWHVETEMGQFLVRFERGGNFPLELSFEANVLESNGWSEVAFEVPPCLLHSIQLKGVAADTQVQLLGAAPPEFRDGEFRGFLPGDGKVQLRWKEAPKPTEGKLFYSAEMLSQVSVSPGLVRQMAWLDFKVMQGELNQVAVRLQGPGDVTRVQGEQILSWKIEPVGSSGDRRLVVQLNQPQKDHFALQLQTQTAVGAFPQTIDVVQLRPESATRFGGFFRIVNEGAVKLEVSQSAGLSQISPDQFPETELTRAALSSSASQRFVYRFSGTAYRLQIAADQILPELSVSEVLSYRVGENDLSIDGEFELEIREAPMRELTLSLPHDFALAQLSANGLNDYFQVGQTNLEMSEFRLVFAQPISGRQIIQLRLERNKALGQPSWVLPRIEVLKAKSVRGHVATVADAGFRLSPERTSGLTEIASAFFPRKLMGIQSAFRIADPGWQAMVRVERLGQTVQADALHLFSIGEGIAYGSTVLNYVISGAPVSSFKVELSAEYYNVEFTGKDVRNWQKTTNGYEVQLHTPVAGPYTLLATYERPFRRQGETLAFTGARPLAVQSEQGHTVIVSAYQFQVKPVDVSPGLLALEPGEVPAEYRLLFDAPVLAAYRYLARPFNLRLALSPLAQGDSLSLVIDRASLSTRISKEGQVLTDARYFVKNRGNTHLRLRLPAGTRLWSVLINGASVVPVSDADSDLIPLPQGSDPNSVLTVDFKLAAVATDLSRVAVTAPIVNAPLMLADWHLTPDVGQRLIYQKGSLRPIGGSVDDSGFAQLYQAFSAPRVARSAALLVCLLACLAFGIITLRWASGAAVRWSFRHLAGLVLGVLSLLVAFVAVNEWLNQLPSGHSEATAGLSFVAPVQQANNTMSIEVLNIEDKTSVGRQLRAGWPALLALPSWALAAVLASRARKLFLIVIGWVLLGSGCLMLPNGTTWFVFAAGAFYFLHVFAPVFIAWWKQPVHKPEATLPAASAGPASAGVVLVIAVLFCGRANSAFAATHESAKAKEPSTADLVVQEIKVVDRFGYGVAKIHWDANKGEILPLLFSPGVLTAIRYPKQDMLLEQAVVPPGMSATVTNSAWSQQLVAKRRGSFDLELEYQVPVENGSGQAGLLLPLPTGVINRLNLTVMNRDVEISSPQAVSVQTELVSSNTVATLVLSPAPAVCLRWKPRSRDVQHEKPVFFAEFSQLYAPGAGVIEAIHFVSLRVAQGELSELVFNIPTGMTITDVADPAPSEQSPGQNAKPGSASVVSLWRFDPDARKLRVNLSSPLARPFTLLIRSQIATGPLPIEQSIGTLAVENAADQFGLVGIATGTEVQLDSAVSDSLSSINLEDFPADLVARLKPNVPGLTLRRAFRYGRPVTQLSLHASAIEPDIRVESQETVSLGEDRTVLAVNSAAAITRAGIFRLSFVLPQGFDVESISGPALSHWTQARMDTNQIITLHLNSKTDGQQNFAISLVGPGVKGTNGWRAPQLVFREATKLGGTVLLVPEQGLRLQVSDSEGLVQLDPQKSGVKQKGVLAFRILQTERRLVLNIEQINAWVQVNSLQHARVGEAQVNVMANLQYQIENTGLKTLHVLISTNAETVRFEGEQVSDFLPIPNSVTNGLQLWEVRLQRRMIGSFVLRLTFQQVLPQNATEWTLRGVQASEVNVQRGFVTVESIGRMQLQVLSPPATLQTAEWQSIPRALQQGLQGNAANFCYRLVESDFALPLKLQSFPAAQLLPGRITSVSLQSVLSDNGVMLTQAKLQMLPGSKRLLRLTLPAGAQFWFAFVSQNGVWPWRENDQILIPLEAPAGGTQSVPVELFYTCKVGDANRRAADFQLFAPKFDLPLENITWRVSFSDQWELTKSSGSLQLQQQELVPLSSGLDVQRYLQSENLQQEQRTKQAESFLAAANSALAQGDPQQARRAFQAAYGLSTHDAAFNEDARVQLHNIKLQEALVGLNVRQAVSGAEASPMNAKLRELRDRKSVSYTQQEAKDILEHNTSDENAAFMKLAERLIQQQDSAANVPAALHASIPEQGRVLTFKRAVVIDPWAELGLHLKIGVTSAAVWLVRGSVLVVSFAALLFLLWLATFRRGAIAV